MSSAREIGGKTPTDMMLFLLKDDNLIAFSEQRDSKGVSRLCKALVIVCNSCIKFDI